jgi:hypothetical protein
MVRSLGKDHLTEIERAIEAEVRNRPPLHEPNHATAPTVSAPAMAMPDYVEHSAGATEIGKLSAEAVVREYEIAAKRDRGDGNGIDGSRQAMRGRNPQRARSDRRVEGNRRPLPRGSKACFPAD